MFILIHLLIVCIFDICFQWDSKLKNIHLFRWILSIITRSGFCAVTWRWEGTVPPPVRVWDRMSAYIKNRLISINPVIYSIRLLCLQVYLFWCNANLRPFKNMIYSYLSSTLQFSIWLYGWWCIFGPSPSDRLAHCFITNTGFAELIQFLYICYIWWWDISSWADFKRVTDTSLVVISVIKCLYLFIFWVFAFFILVSYGTVSSKISIFSSILSIITRSGFCAVTRRWGGTVPPSGKVWDGMSAYIKNRSISINPVIYLIRLLCLQVYLFLV